MHSGITDLTDYTSLVEPVTLAQAKAHCRVLSTNDDTYLTTLLTIARQAAETFCGLTLVPKTLMLSLDNWPRGRDVWWDGVREGDLSLITGNGQTERSIPLPLCPITGVTSINVYDDSDGVQLFPATSYYVDKVDPLRRGRVTLRRNAVWIPALRVSNAIEITFTAGFGGTGPVLPAEIKQGMLLFIQYLYRNRGEVPDSAIGPSGAELMWLKKQNLDR